MRKYRSIFSTTTILSSTSKPNATTIPTMLNWLMVIPNISSKNNPMASDKGIETITTIEARTPRGRRVNNTRKIAMAKSRVKPPRRVRTLLALSKLCS